MPGSAGIAEGPVRLIREPAEFGALRAGDVLVAPFTNPTWAPLSHAAIVAREYGIPAVMGTGDGTRLLRDGQRVRVDGTRGLVFLA